MHILSDARAKIVRVPYFQKLLLKF